MKFRSNRLDAMSLSRAARPRSPASVAVVLSHR
ncbi:Uncharacterised protein [Bordetella pertussis]|nr:Uncharacterised protein [Bordetella pertussis]